MITNTKETFTTIGELKQLIASYPDNTEISFLGSLAFIEKNKTDLSLGFVPECRFNINFGGPKASCEEVLSIFMGVNGQHFGKTFDWETNEMMITNNDTDMFVSISGDCAWSFHQAFCELHPSESNTTLLELSRRLNLYIEGW